MTNPTQYRSLKLFDIQPGIRLRLKSNGPHMPDTFTLCRFWKDWVLVSEDHEVVEFYPCAYTEKLWEIQIGDKL